MRQVVDEVKERREDPAIIRTKEKYRTVICCILPEGKGLLFVRSIFASVFLSWIWFRAEAPDARRNIPSRGNNCNSDTLPEKMIMAAKAENATATDTFQRISVRKL